jgi:hypothetical protein
MAAIRQAGEAAKKKQQFEEMKQRNLIRARKGLAG